MEPDSVSVREMETKPYRDGEQFQDLVFNFLTAITYYCNEYWMRVCIVHCVPL